MDYLCQKMSHVIFSITMILLLSFSALTLGVIDTYQEVPSIGEILYPSSSTQIQLAGNDIHLTGFGRDYCVYYDSYSEERWLRHEAGITKWKEGFTTYRMGFVFENSPIQPKGSHGSSVYTATKLDRVLEIFDGWGMKVIMMLQNNYDCQHYIGSPEWRASWLDLVQTFKGDHRLAAIGLFSEPQHFENVDSPWAAYSTWYPSIKTRYELQEEFALLIREIHKIDPDRVVIYPYPGFQYDDYTEWFADLEKIGINKVQNVIFDVTHPYFFENEWDMGMTPTQKAAWYAKKQIIPSVNFFGAERIFCGETFAWVGTTVAGVPATASLQSEWITAIVNQFTKYGMGFNIWDTVPGSTRWTVTGPAIEASNYPSLTF
jgi:hypothetical protein